MQLSVQNNEKKLKRGKKGIIVGITEEAGTTITKIFSWNGNQNGTHEALKKILNARNGI